MKRGNFAEELKRRFAASLQSAAWFHPGLRLAAAVSGGADSVALLTLLAETRSRLGFVLSAVHFNHQLRGKASDADEKFVAALAEKFGVTLHIGRADVARKARNEKSNLEDAARRARYAFFEKLAGQGRFDAVATAHTMDDQAETVLAHILRGTGIGGLAGIHPSAASVRRPLLDFRREDLRKYLRAKKQPWREDATNRDTNRSRARMRKKLLPLLVKDFNPAAVEHLAGLAQRAREQALFMDQLAAQLFDRLAARDRSAVRVRITSLLDPLGLGNAEAAASLRKVLLEKIVAQIKTGSGQISAVHLAAVVRLAQRGEPGKRLQLPGRVDALRETEALVFRARS
ncbi:MAG TPA: tRNA lysidine(34) synthetase TilS [Candidatus Acidoferrum sp.]|nr:tRNA lysidine(34) synthetase TilS [Candidatus Acidoferrum sp.]